MKLSDTHIRDISQSLDCGFICYVHKESYEVLTIPDETRFMSETDDWNEDKKKVEAESEKYAMIEPPMSNQTFRMMADFSESVEDDMVRSKLISALNGKKPFANFRFEINNSGPFRQKWFDFKNQWLMDYVREELEMDFRDD